MKKILSIFISAVLLISGLCISASASQMSKPTEEDGFVEGVFIYNVTDEKATVISCDENASGEVIVPSTLGGYPVVAIAEWAFWSCYDVESIILPDSVESIGCGAFCGLSFTESIDLGNGVKTIEKDALGACFALKTIHFPKTLTSLNGNPFASGHNLETITIDEANPTFSVKGNCLIENASKKLIVAGKNCEIPNDGSVEVIGEYAFSFLDETSNITIPQTVKKIQQGAFIWCEDISIEFLNNSIEIHEYIFNDPAKECVKKIKCYENSTAHAYAIKNDVPVEFIVDKVEEQKPEIIEGKDTNYEQTQKIDLVIKSNADFKDFESVLVDGKEIDKDNYTVKSGSTIVTLKADYLKTLSVGKHTVGIKSKSGIAETTITVANAGATASSQTSDTTTETAEDTNVIASPKTGDKTPIIPVLMLMIISIVSVALTMKKLRCNN